MLTVASYRFMPSYMRVLLGRVACLFAVTIGQAYDTVDRVSGQELSPFDEPIVAVASADDLYRTGKYEAAYELAKAEFDAGVWNEKWPRLLMRCQLTLGKYAEALQTYEQAIARYTQSLPLRLLGREALLYNNRPEDAERTADEIFTILQQTSTRFASADTLVAAGRYFVLRNEDARQVLTLFYDRVSQADPKHLDVRVATAELALKKGDYQEASKALQAALEINDQEPQVHYLQARAWETTDSSKSTAALQQALQLNPQHVPSLLFLIESKLDREQYEAAATQIEEVLQINPQQWEAWAYKAVLAHLRGEFEQEPKWREQALATWKTNPQVDHLIGRKLSDHYRFAVGAEYQRRSLAFDTSHEPAKFQLAQDLLRLGDGEIGWQIAAEVNKADPYNVVVHNLMTLSDRLAGYTTLTADGVELRMEPREARVYGTRALELLVQAKQTLSAKYQVQLPDPIQVEIFPQQKDFAIRTFGLPGGDGYLGVCFGRVITANSPASQGARPSNWESVLWHELCHAVTLEKSKNRMPRWLSEGISVYEERQRNPSWGQTMTPEYRLLLTDPKVAKVSELSGSFLNPATPLHLNFAYYQSSLVVEYLVEQFGMPAMLSLLNELGNGLSINDAISRTMRPIESIDEGFFTWSRSKAEAFAAKADWSLPDDQDKAEDETELGRLAEQRAQPPVIQQLAEIGELRRAEQWEELVARGETLVSLGLRYPARDGLLESLALAYQQLNDREKELATLKQVDELSSDALFALKPLIEQSQAAEDWQSVFDYANKWIAIQPLQPFGHERLAEAAMHLDQPALALTALRTLRELSPPDPAALSLKIAQAHWQLDQSEAAKRAVLEALELAPRYREAHRLLLQIRNGKPTTP